MLSCRVPQLKKHVYYLYDHYYLPMLVYRHRPITNKFTKMGIKASSLELKSLSLLLSSLARRNILWREFAYEIFHDMRLTTGNCCWSSTTILLDLRSAVMIYFKCWLYGMWNKFGQQSLASKRSGTMEKSGRYSVCLAPAIIC